MNTLEDVKRIIDEFYTKTAQWMEASSQAQVLPLDACWREAERKFGKGLMELRKIKLYREDARAFRLVKSSFELAIKACQAGAKGRYEEATQLVKKSGKLLRRYVKAVN